MSTANPEAKADQPGFYDARYEHGYMEGFLDPYEACRVVTVRDVLRTLPAAPERVLDYGCGQGRYLDVIRERFPNARLSGSDVSEVALEQARRQRPWAEYVAMDDERVPLAEGSFDLVSLGRGARARGRRGARDGRARPPARAGRSARADDAVREPGLARMAAQPPARRAAAHGRRLWPLRHRRARSPAPADQPRPARAAGARRARGRSRRLPRAAFRRADDQDPGTRRAAHRTPRMVAFGLLDWRLFRRLPNGATKVVSAHRPPDGGRS